MDRLHEADGMKQTGASSAFWQFSLEVYARPQVAELCLALQDEHDFDVNVLLFCLWVAQGSRTTLDQSDIGQLLSGIAPLSENLVRPVRSARRWVRSRLDNVKDTVPTAGLADLYAALKAVELKAERQVQSVLVELLRPVSGKLGASAESAAHASLETYRQTIGAPQAAAVLLSQLAVRAFASEAEPGISQT